MELEILVLRKNYKTLVNEKFSINLTKTELLILEALAKKKIAQKEATCLFI